MYTLNQLANKFEDFFNAHQFVNRFTFGVYELSQINKNYVFPHVHIQPDTASVESLVGITFEMVIQDLPRVEDNKDRTIREILSDTFQTVLDFQAYLKKGDDFFEYDQFQFQLNSIEARWDASTQTTAGWQMNFTLSFHNDESICDIPLVGVPPTPGTICEPATLVDVDGNTLREIASGANFTLRNYSIRNSGLLTYTAPVTAVSLIGRISGDTLENVIAGFSEDTPTISDTAQDIYDGASEDLRTELSTLICGATEIIPDLVRPTRTTVSFRDGDLGWQYNNGVFNRLDADRTGRVRVLGADNYTLSADTLNSFGTTARYTFDDGTQAWNGTSFDTDYGDATEYVIIDHLSDLVIYVANLGQQNWDGAIDACQSLAVGTYNWRAGAADEWDRILPDRANNYYTGGNPLRRGVVSGYNSEAFFWTSQTDQIIASTNAFRYSNALETSRRAKTDSNLMTVYALANYEP